METLLRASFDVCEAFTGLMPLQQTCEEQIPASNAWQKLSVQPVHLISLAIAHPNEGSAIVLDAGDYELDIDADQVGRVRLRSTGSFRRLQLHYLAGLSNTWTGLPEAIRQGIIRLAAHHYRERDGADDTPPAAVAALWRPWRRLRLT